MSTPAPRLTRCESCARVFDTQSFNTGQGFVCHCGAAVVVREVPAHDSAVIRCSACGGSRAPNATACTFCGASFTLRDRELSGMCGHCGVRASRGDTYCHGCGQPIVDGAHAARPGEKHCPVCADAPELTHRQLRDAALLECVRCGGVWLDRQAFATLAAAAREEARKLGAERPKHAVHAPPPQSGPAYRRCVECDAVMQRKNYGRKSGVIVDVCVAHGTWFDLHELEQVLAWLRAGGTEQADPKPTRPVGETIVPSMTASQRAPWQAEGDGLGDVAGFVRDLVDLFFSR